MLGCASDIFSHIRNGCAITQFEEAPNVVSTLNQVHDLDFPPACQSDPKGSLWATELAADLMVMSVTPRGATRNYLLCELS